MRIFKCQILKKLILTKVIKIVATTPGVRF